MHRLTYVATLFAASLFAVTCSVNGQQPEPGLPSYSQTKVLPNIVPVTRGCRQHTGYYTGHTFKNGKSEVITSSHILDPIPESSLIDAKRCADETIRVETFRAEVVSVNEEQQWLILAAPLRHERKIIPLATRDAVAGEDVFAFTGADGLSNVFVKGTVKDSAKTCMLITDFIVVGGSSGSPIFGRDNAVVGIIGGRRHRSYMLGQYQVGLLTSYAASSACITAALADARSRYESGPVPAASSLSGRNSKQ